MVRVNGLIYVVHDVALFEIRIVQRRDTLGVQELFKQRVDIRFIHDCRRIDRAPASIRQMLDLRSRQILVQMADGQNPVKANPAPSGVCQQHGVAE